MPDVSKPPLHTLPYDELMAKLRALTNLQVVEDPACVLRLQARRRPVPRLEGRADVVTLTAGTASRAVRDPRPAGGRGHGRGVPGARPAAGARRRAEGDPDGGGAERGAAEAVRGRGAGGGAADATRTSCRCSTWGRTTARPYVVFELLEGETLRQRLRTRAAAAALRGGDGGAGVPWAAGGARAGDPAPGPQAGEPVPDVGRAS